MAVHTPDWLKQHAGDIQLSKDGHSAGVYFAGQLQYLLIPVPAKGQLSCRITETINGQRLDGEGVYPNADDALRGGLEQLRAKLGW